MSDIKEQLKYYVSAIETQLEKYIPQTLCAENRVIQAMRYSLLAGGKRIRGALTLGFYKMLRNDINTALPFACAVEMIHAYSLIHDDLPCMDNDNMRRGKAACHIKYGEACALLAGDALNTLAFNIISQDNFAENIPQKCILKCINILSEAAGCNGMVAGQQIDLMQQGKPTSQEVLMKMYNKKTGALINAAAIMGCTAAKADDYTINSALEYSKNLGLAFQIKDDILDITGDVNKLGKPVGSDRENNKTTYATLFGIEKAKQKIKELEYNAKKALAAIDYDTDFLLGLVDLLAYREN